MRNVVFFTCFTFLVYFPSVAKAALPAEKSEPFVRRSIQEFLIASRIECSNPQNSWLLIRYFSEDIPTFRRALTTFVDYKFCSIQRRWHSLDDYLRERRRIQSAISQKRINENPPLIIVISDDDIRDAESYQQMLDGMFIEKLFEE